jgi:hypothetical protein
LQADKHNTRFIAGKIIPAVSTPLSVYLFIYLSFPGDTRQGPLSSEHGTYKTAKAAFWPWLSGKWSLKPFKVFPLRSEAVCEDKCGTSTTVKARFWPWLSGKKSLKPFKLFSFRSESV